MKWVGQVWNCAQWQALVLKKFSATRVGIVYFTVAGRTVVFDLS